MSLLSVTGLSHSFGDKELFRNVSFELFNGEKMGLVGHNGCGKSSLLKVLIGELIHEKGEIKWNPKAKVGYLDQYAELDPENTIKTYLQTAFSELFEIEKKLEEVNILLEEKSTEELINESAKYHLILEQSGFYELDSYISKVASGLGITPLGMDKTVATLSGGQRAKVILGKLLLENPDLLLLDEPTNFLDKSHIDWLAKFLKNFKGAFIIVSHNFDFLDSITTCICDIEFETLSRYTGNLTAYLVAKDKRKEQYIKDFEAQKKFISKTEDFIAKNKARASTANMAKSREKVLNKLDRIAPPKTIKKANFKFQFQPLTTKNMLDVDNLVVGYYYPILPKVSFSVEKGKKVVVTGFNGIGKSTLIKTIIGELPAISGGFKLGEKVSIGYFKQEFVWNDEETTPFSYISSLYPKFTKKQIYGYLAQVGISHEHIEQKLSTLSGGEQAKVRLCHLVLTPCNLLILDEPTNHLDVETKAMLNKAIKAFEGSVIVISHESGFYEDFVDNVLNIEKLIV